MIETISQLLKNGANPALRYQNDDGLLEDLARVIASHIEKNCIPTALLGQLATLIQEHDYRLVADYLAASDRHDEVMLSILNDLIRSQDVVARRRHRHQYAYARFASASPVPGRAKAVFVERLDDIFSSEDRKLMVHLRDEEYRAPLSALIEELGTGLGTFIEQQYDLPGLNAVVRQGLVRSWNLPDGRPVVSKRENAHKKDRFRREQANYEALLSRLGRPARVVHNPCDPTDSIAFRVVQPLAVIYDGYSKHRYSILVHEEGVSLEDLFYTVRDVHLRHRLLTHYRLLLDSLYEYGILWGDMSPRNILLKWQGHTATYTLMDFEKTSILDTPISLAQRIEHCRGQIGVEELCVLCPLDEALNCLEGYFNPSTWDLQSKSALPFQPRPDTADLLRGRGIAGVTIGEYNRIDKAILAVRAPDVNPRTNARRFPGHLGFKVEHYLSCSGSPEAGDYDRKTTEILISAKELGFFDELVALLTVLTSKVESAFLKSEFHSILRGGFSGMQMPPKHEIGNLTAVIDLCYQQRNDANAYRHLAAQFEEVISSTQEYGSH